MHSQSNKLHPDTVRLGEWWPYGHLRQRNERRSKLAQAQLAKRRQSIERAIQAARERLFRPSA